MKRLVIYSHTAFLTFILGTLAVYLFTSPSNETLVQETSKKFDIHLERLEVKDSDVSRWNSNNGYLDMFDAVFFDEQTVLALYLQGGMRTSHDGGKTWQRLFINGGGLPKATHGFTLWGMDFIDSQNGWAFGTCLIKTEDGGQTWTNVKLPEWIDNLKVKFLNKEVGYVAGRGGYCERGSGTCNLWMSVYKTTDGGKSWKRSFKTRDVDTPWDVAFIDENNAMITSNGGWLFRTADGGKSWKAVIDKDYQHVMSISRSPNGRFWLFGTNIIRFSDDLGATWQTADKLDQTVVNHEWWSVDFAKGGLGIAVSEDAAIAMTRDGGQSWKLVTSNLHVKGKIPVPDNPFDEALRRIKLYGNTGIIQGSQRDYLITIRDSDNH